MTVELFVASPTHVGPIAVSMRQADRIEAAAWGHSPKAALRLGLRGSSVALTAKVDGRPIAMMGVTPVSMLEGTGIPWFLGTDAVLREGRALVDLGGRVLKAWSTSFNRLENWVWIDNAPAIRLLLRWGFQLADDSQDIGGLPFRRFWRDG